MLIGINQNRVSALDTNGSSEEVAAEYFLDQVIREVIAEGHPSAMRKIAFTATTGAAKTITNIATGTDSVTITAAAHGFVVGQTVVISGSDSTPSIDGTYYVLTAPTANTFTIKPSAAVTVAGANGTATSQSGEIPLGNAAPRALKIRGTGKHEKKDLTIRAQLVYDPDAGVTTCFSAAEAVTLEVFEQVATTSPENFEELAEDLKQAIIARAVQSYRARRKPDQLSDAFLARDVSTRENIRDRPTRRERPENPPPGYAWPGAPGQPGRVSGQRDVRRCGRHVKAARHRV